VIISRAPVSYRADGVSGYGWLLGPLTLPAWTAATTSISIRKSGRTRLARLARERVAAHAAADVAEDELFGAGRRGDEVPEDAWSPRSRDSRIAAALASLKAQREEARAAEAARVEAYRARHAAGERAGCLPASAAVAEAEANLARVRATRAAQLAKLEERYAAGQPRRGRPAGVDDYCRVKQAEAKAEAAKARAADAERTAAGREANRTGPGPVRNITDPDSRLMPVRGGGFIQGYNAQNMASGDGLVIATELTDDQAGCPWFEPMLARAQEAAALIQAHRPAEGGGAGQDSGGIGQVLADAGYCSEANLTCDGPDRLIATGKGRDLEQAARDPDSADPDRGGPAIQAMRERLKTGDGIAAYRQRGHIAETPTATSSTTWACGSCRSAASAKPPPNGPSPLPCTTCSRP
jgi:hypothetical protein